MRTQEELVAYLADKEGQDPLGFTVEALVPLLDFEHARPWLRPEVSEAEWSREAPSQEGVQGVAGEYLEFAMGKALDHRGLSAWRSILKLRAWTFALGNEEMLALLEDDDNYAPYGAPMLAALAEWLEVEQPSDPRWLRMAEGLSCYDGCTECGV